MKRLRMAVEPRADRPRMEPSYRPVGAFSPPRGEGNGAVLNVDVSVDARPVYQLAGFGMRLHIELTRC
jgi:hypothetical protein